MTLPSPHFLVNFKVYEGTGGEDGLELARIVERVAERTDTRLVVAPQTPDVRLVADAVDVPVVAQRVDPIGPGAHNGGILPETVANAGADGVFVNHPEARETVGDLRTVVRRCREVGLATIVAVDDASLGRAVATLEPDWLLFERPEDVASDRPLVQSDPDRVRAFVEAIEAVAPETRVFVGGGIASPADVEAAFECGVDATGAASAFVRAADPEAWLRGVAKAVPRPG